jgi:hypothetical protein
MGPSLDDLISLVKQRGTADRFPEKDELHGLLEPFRELPDQESLRLALAATLRKGDRLVARVAAESLAYLGQDAAGPLLVAIAMDERLGTSQRAAAVWAMDRHLPGFRGQLAPEEQLLCISLPVFEMLEDPEADQGFGLKMMLGSYTGMPGAARGAFLTAITQAASERGHRLAGLCMHLLGAEADGERRRRLLDLAAADGTQEAADLLAAFAAKATDEDEAKHARRHLHLLRAKGLRGVARPDLRECRALVTGVDGDACFSVNLIIPRVPTFDIANLLFHLETGLRDGFVLQNLPGRSVDDLVEKIKEGCGTITGFLPMPLAARMVDEALRPTKPSVLRNPELANVIALAEPALAEARKTDFVEPAPPTDVDVTPQEAGGLLGSEGFESWFFETHEGTVKQSLAAFAKPIRSKGKAGYRTFANRLAKATRELRDRLRADDEHHRLQRMLRHQARLLECAGDAQRADLCRKLAVEVERPESVFLANMAARAILDALQESPDDERPSRFVEAREQLRAQLAQEEHGHCKQDVAGLDMAAAAHTEMVILNREAPSAQRVPLAAIESAALALGGAFVDSVVRGRGKQSDRLFADVKAELDRRDLFPGPERARVAEEILSGMANLRDSICTEVCPHRCFENPKGDGRAAFYAEGLPWHESTGRPRRRSRNEA